MSNGDVTLTHRDLAQALGVSETTIKSYRRKFPLFIPLYSQGKPLRFKPQALEVCRTIRDGFGADLSVEEVRSRLSLQFPDVVKNRKDSVSVESPGAAPVEVPLAGSLQSLALAMERLAKAQEETHRRLGQVQEIMGDFLTLQLGREDAFARGVEALQQSWERSLGELRLERPQVEAAQSAASPDATDGAGLAAPPGEQGRTLRVTVQNVFGESAEYRIASGLEPRSVSAPEPASAGEGAQAPTEPPRLLTVLPLVVRSATGEYLGVAGKAEGAFCLQDLDALLGRAYAPPHHFGREWRHLGGTAWQLRLEQADAIRPQRYVLELEPVQTPKGNTVTLLRRFEVQGREMPPPNLYALIRQLKAPV